MKYRLLCLAMISLSGLACAPKNQTIAEQIRIELAQALKDNQAYAQQYEQPPAAIQAALLPAMALPPPPAHPPVLEKRFDINANNMPAPAFFLSLVRDTPYDLVVHPEVAGNITLSLKQVTIEEVMDILQQLYGYEYQRIHQHFQVLPIRLQSRVYQIDYLNTKRVGSSITKISSAQTRVGDSGADSTAESNQVSTQTTVDFWADLSQALTSIIGTEDGRSVVITPHTGTIVIRSMPRELREVESLLRIYQNSLDRQVILEAKILEVILNDGFQSGINWNAITRLEGNASAALQGIIGEPLQNNFNTNLGGVVRTTLALDDFTAVVDLLKEQGTVQTLSSPRIATINNQKAIIKVGADEFFVTEISIQSVVDNNGNQLQPEVEVQLTQFFSGIALDVTPQINDNNEVTIHIHPTITDVQEQNKIIALGNGNNLNLPLALNNVRESDTIIRAKSGQIILLGGLMQKIAKQDDATIPILGSVPIIGELFKQSRQSSIKSELVILIRPTVMQHTRDWSAAITHATQGFNTLNQQLIQGGDPQSLGR